MQALRAFKMPIRQPQNESFGPRAANFAHKVAVTGLFALTVYGFVGGMYLAYDSIEVVNKQKEEAMRNHQAQAANQ
jgi:hypothetical protein